MALFECDLTLSKKKKQCKKTNTKRNKKKEQLKGTKLSKNVELDSVAKLQLYLNYNWILTNFQGLNHTDKHLSQVDYHNT